MAASIDLNDYFVDNNQVASLGDLEDGVEQGTISGIDRTNMASGATVVTIAASAPTSPVNGECWNDTSALTGAPEVRPMIWNNASSEWLGRSVIYSASAPATTTTGWFWYDMTLEMLRMYRSATQDLHGVAGWHPVDSAAYQLWTNKSGSEVLANRVVTQYTAAAVERAFSTSADPKVMTVIGVTMEAISADAVGVVAMVAGGAYVDIYCNVAAGNIALGDGIVNSSAAGEGRTVGALVGNPNSTATLQRTGYPLGCFARAQQASTVATITACKLLGHIGEGCFQRKASTVIAALANGLANTNWDGGYDEVNVADYPPTVGGNDFILDPKQKPIMGVMLDVFAVYTVTQSSGAQVTGSVALSFAKDAATALNTLQHKQVLAIGNEAGRTGCLNGNVIVPTSDGTPYTALGNKFYWSGVKTSTLGTPTVTDASFSAVGYVYALMMGASFLLGGGF